MIFQSSKHKRNRYHRVSVLCFQAISIHGRQFHRVRRSQHRKYQPGTVDMPYHELFDNPVCKTVAHASCLECIPQCESCVYAPYCGTCPVLNYYENKSVFMSNPNGYKCKIYKGMLDSIFAILHGEDEEARNILHGWVGV